MLLKFIFFFTAKSYILFGGSTVVRTRMGKGHKRSTHRDIRPGYDLDGGAPAEPSRARVGLRARTPFALRTASAHF